MEQPSDQLKTLRSANATEALLFGKQTQQEMAGFSTKLLEQTQQSAAEDSGKLMEQMTALISDDKMSGYKKLPLIGKVSVSLDAVRKSYEQAEPIIQDLTEKLQKNQLMLEKDKATLQALHAKSDALQNQLEELIQTGEAALSQGHTSNSALARRIADLKRSKLVAAQQSAQIELLKQADQNLIAKIDSLLTEALPTWHAQLTLTLGLSAQSRAATVSSELDKALSQLNAQNAQAIKESAEHVARAQGQTETNQEMLEQLNQTLINALQDTLQTQQESVSVQKQSLQQQEAFEQGLTSALASTVPTSEGC